MRDHPPYLEMAFGHYADFGEIGIGGHQIQPAMAHSKAFDGEIAVNETHCNISVTRVERTVDDQQVAVVDAGFNH